MLFFVLLKNRKEIFKDSGLLIIKLLPLLQVQVINET